MCTHNRFYVPRRAVISPRLGVELLIRQRWAPCRRWIPPCGPSEPRAACRVWLQASHRRSHRWVTSYTPGPVWATQARRIEKYLTVNLMLLNNNNLKKETWATLKFFIQAVWCFLMFLLIYFFRIKGALCNFFTGLHTKTQLLMQVTVVCKS